MQDSSPLIYVLAFLAVVLFVQAVTSVVFASRDRQREVNRRLTMLGSGMEPHAVYTVLVRKKPADTSNQRPGTALLQRLDLRLGQAGVSIPAVRFIAIIAAVSVFLWVVSVLVTGSGIADAVVSLLASFGIVSALTSLWLERRRRVRVKRIEEQLPTALDVIVRGLRAGHPVISAIQLAATEMGDPLGSELGVVVDESTYGYELRDALTNLARRTDSEDAQFMAVSVGIQAQTGGNLAEILENLATVVRERAGLTKRVHALSSEGRVSAGLLTVLPILMVLGLGLMSPGYYTSKFSDPLFWPIMGGVLVLYGIGRIWIYRITHFRY
jgi:tight adherence protein B